jgi:hypothetical protein
MDKTRDFFKIENNTVTKRIERMLFPRGTATSCDAQTNDVRAHAASPKSNDQVRGLGGTACGRLGSVFQSSEESHFTGVHPPNMFPFDSKMTVRAFGCPSQRV